MGARRASSQDIVVAAWVTGGRRVERGGDRLIPRSRAWHDIPIPQRLRWLGPRLSLSLRRRFFPSDFFSFNRELFSFVGPFRGALPLALPAPRSRPPRLPVAQRGRSAGRSPATSSLPLFLTPRPRWRPPSHCLIFIPCNILRIDCWRPALLVFPLRAALGSAFIIELRDWTVVAPVR